MSVPYTFSPGTLVSSSQVNDNFTALDTQKAALSGASFTGSVYVLSGNVGIGTDNPSSPLEVASAATNLYITRSGGLPGTIILRTANGTLASPTATTVGNQLLVIAGTGHNGSSFVSPPSSAIRAVALENFTGTANGTAITFETTPIGSPASSRAEAMRIDGSGNVGIGTSSPSASAILDVQSTTKGVRMPNMTTTQKNAIASPAAGTMVFDTTLAKLCVYTGAAWQTITSA